jgi:hypothetical protein
VFLTAVDDGRYVWAMCGFDFASEDIRTYVMRQASQFAREVLDLEMDFGDLQHSWEIGAIPGEVTLREIAEASGVALELPGSLADRIDEPMRLGKALLLFAPINGWEGILDVRDGSTGYEQLIRYTQDHADD